MEHPGIEVTGLRVDAAITVAAPPERVWPLLADVTNVGRWSPECVHAAWLMPASAAAPGARFSGRNRAPGGFEWTVTCVITEADRPAALAWIVLDDDVSDDATAGHTSSAWRYELGPAAGGTLVRNSFVHGAGDSGLRWMMRRHPDRAASIVAERRAQLHGNMLSTLAGLKAEAEQAAAR
ncbi:MAG TPA: SRPBCC family protein [Streptosporangiaceae bacterium]